MPTYEKLENTEWTLVLVDSFVIMDRLNMCFSCDRGITHSCGVIVELFTWCGHFAAYGQTHSFMSLLKLIVYTTEYFLF